MLIYHLFLYFPMFPFDSPENIRKPKVFCCFQGDQKGTLGRKELINDLQNIILAYTNVKQWSVNNIKLKCSQFGQRVSGIF